jgi:hypothetical protein
VENAATVICPNTPLRRASTWRDDFDEKFSQEAERYEYATRIEIDAVDLHGQVDS